MTDIAKLTDLELDKAIGEAESDTPEEDALLAEAFKRHKEKMSKIPIEERRRRSYERFILHDDDVELGK